jgi:hypothetical protein
MGLTGMDDTTVYTDFRLQANHLADTGERGPAEAAVRRDLAAAYQLAPASRSAAEGDVRATLDRYAAVPATR